VDEAEHSSLTGGDCRPAIAKGEGEWGSGGRPLLRQLSGPHMTVSGFMLVFLSVSLSSMLFLIVGDYW
jgi:hypothetical protein